METKELILNESIIKIRVKLQNSKIKKTGKNKFAGFEYYELGDFLPKLNELMLEENINDLFTIENDEVKLILMKGEEKQEYKMPFRIFETPLTKDGKQSMQDIQYLGALNTYYKRYLYLNAFGITDGEVIDSMNSEEIKKPIKQETKEILITEKQIELIKELDQERVKKALEFYEKENIEDLTLVQASQLIAKIKGEK
jgi:peptidyl-prolyl cis-trans isomerase family protein|nr:MAG TPA: ERF superfamily protein [Caudoviricetes sp.]